MRNRRQFWREACGLGSSATFRLLTFIKIHRLSTIGDEDQECNYVDAQRSTISSPRWGEGGRAKRRPGEGAKQKPATFIRCLGPYYCFFEGADWSFTADMSAGSPSDVLPGTLKT